MEEGQIIRLSYDMWLENVDGVFDTTDRDRASESGIFNPQHHYGPIVAVVGAGRLVPGLEKAVKETKKAGEWQEVTLQAADAFGPRDPKLIETVPMQRFKTSKVKPTLGARITYKNKSATITRVAGGRVWVDTNSPLAGREVKYRFQVEELIEDPAARIEALIELGYRQGTPFEVTLDGKTVDIIVPDQVKYDQQWPLSKFRISHDIGRFTDVEKVRFIEEYTTAAPESHTHADGTVHEGPAHGDDALETAGEDAPAAETAEAAPST